MSSARSCSISLSSAAAGSAPDCANTTQVWWASTPEPCPALAQELTAYAASEIDHATCVKIEEHLASCSRCTGPCQALQRIVSMCRSIPGNAVPANVRAAVRGAIVDVIAR